MFSFWNRRIITITLITLIWLLMFISFTKLKPMGTHPKWAEILRLDGEGVGREWDRWWVLYYLIFANFPWKISKIINGNFYTDGKRNRRSSPSSSHLVDISKCVINLSMHHSSTTRSTCRLIFLLIRSLTIFYWERFHSNTKCNDSCKIFDISFGIQIRRLIASTFIAYSTTRPL